jgi:hypothetical protein
MRRNQTARTRINAAIFEALETRQLMASTQTEALQAQHMPGVCSCPGCQPQAPISPEEQALVQQQREEALEQLSQTKAPRVPISQVPSLNSRPGAPKTIYLDFNGAAAFTWRGQNSDGSQIINYSVTGMGGGTTPVPAFTLDGNANDFSTFEEQAIRNMHSWVAEKFSPFNINVTTVDPGSYNYGTSLRVLVGGADADWLNENAGGRASIGAIRDDRMDRTCFVFPVGNMPFSTATNLDPRDLRYLGETIAHEAGHVLGLRHQRQNLGMGAVDNYYDGTGAESPIMGGSSNNATARGIWWKTNTFGQSSPDAVADELNFLTSTFPDEGPLPYAADDIPSNVTPSITVLGNGTFAPVSGFDQSTRVNSGTLERASDQDTWRFIASTNQGTFSVSPWARGGMLSLNATLLNSSGQVVPSTVSANGNGVTINTTSLSAGSAYFIRVSSKGGYGDIGQYQLTGQMAALASFDSTTGTLSINGVPGNNNMRLWLHYGPNELVIENNGGTQRFASWPINQINVQLGNGTDTLEIEPLANYAGGPGIPITVDLGGGSDTMKVQDYNGITPFNVWSSQVQWVNMTANYSGVERLDMISGPGDDQFNIRELGLGTAVHAWGYGGNDTMTIHRDVVRSTGMHTYFHGSSGTDTLKVDGSSRFAGDRASAGMGIIDGHVDTNAQGYVRESHFDSEVEAISLIGGDTNEIFGIYNLPATITTLSVDMGKGDDSIWMGLSDWGQGVGTPFSNAIKAAVNVVGGDGRDSIYIDDVYGSASTYNLTANTFASSGGGNVTYWGDVESLHVDGRTTGGVVYNIWSSSATTAAVLNAGSASDAFNIYHSQGAATMNGNGGNDYFYISNGGQLGTLSAATLIDGGTGEGDYASFNDVSSPYAVTHQTLNDSAFGSMGYRNLDGIGITLGPGNDYLYIRSTAAGTPITVDAMAGNDSLLLGRSYFVVGEQPTLDGIRSRINFNGGEGTDTVTLTDSSTTVDSEWTFDQGKIGRKDKAQADEDSDGNRPILDILYDHNSVERLSLEAGAGNDKITAAYAFAIATFKGGAGADQFEIPVFGNTPAVSIDGEAGFDGLTIGTHSLISGDWVITDNRITQAQWYFTAIANYAGLEGIIATGNATAANTFYVQSTATPIQLHGGTADDSFVIGNNNLANGIRAMVYVNGAGGTNNSLIINDHADTTNNYVTIDQTYIGGYQGDNLFGPGGFVTGPGAQSTIINLGSGSDTIAAQPNAVANLALSGGAGTNSLMLGLATTTNPVINTFGANGSVTSSNRKPVTFWNFGAVQSDNVAPAVVSSSFNHNVPAGQKPSLTFRFSEDVSRQLSVAYLDLKNVHTNQPIPAANVALSYDLATNTATFTFPGYPNGVLPNGSYAARIHTSLIDAFGNAMAVDQTLNFFVLAGDANHDGKVDVADLGILASNWQQTGRTFSQGDFTYDGKVDVADLGILASNWQGSLPMPSLPQGSGEPTTAGRTIRQARMTDVVDSLA